MVISNVSRPSPLHRRTYHRIQLALYLLMLQRLLEHAPLTIAGREAGPDAIEGCVGGANLMKRRTSHKRFSSCRR